MGALKRTGLALRGARTQALLMCLCALAFALSVFASSAYSQAGANEAGYEFTDAATAITYKVTVPADAAGGTAGEVELADGKAFAGSIITVGSVEHDGLSYAVTAVRYSAFEGNAKLQRVVFTQDLTAVSTAKFGQLSFQRRAVGARAFASCENLESVEFACARVNGIGDEAFYKCGKLSSISFADGLEIFGEGKAFGIGSRAFARTAITSIRIPFISCAKRTGDYYSAYDHDYELEPEDRDTSGYMGCWHDKLTYFGIEARGICDGAFSGTPLETIVFEAGNEHGMFAYWSAAGAGLRYLPTLKSVVYEAQQPYYGDPNRTLNNGAAKEVWGLDSSDEEGTQVADPTFYYAVDFYTTQQQAEDDDAAGSARLARVEYARGTSVGAIQSADAAALEGCAYATPADYAQAGYADGTTPDPQAAACAAQRAGVAGFEGASQHSWVWMLGDTQSRRSGLTDSCSAWLVRADDLSAGRLGTDPSGEDQIGTMQLLCDQNLSQGSTQNSAFDYQRYYAADSVYVFSEESIKAYAGMDTCHLRVGATPWFSLNSRGLSGLLEQMTLYGARGEELDLADSARFAVTLSVYGKEDGSLREVGIADLEEGPVLLTVTPLEGSGYSPQSCLQEWVLVKGQACSVKQLYTANAHETWRKAVYSNGTGNANPVQFSVDSGFAVGVSSGDAAAALAAVAYAGLVKGPVSVVSSESDYGFSIALPGSFYSTGDIYGDMERLERGAGESDAALAVSNYRAFNSNRSRWGIDSSTRWGDTALLVNPGNLASVAAAAASYSYAQAAPVFYTEDDGSLGAATRECLAEFEHVIVLGGAELVSDAVLQEVQAALGSGGVAERLSGTVLGDGGQESGSTCSLALAAAEALTTGSGAPCNAGAVAVIVASGPDAVIDAVGAVNYTGYYGGVMLSAAGTADAKRVLAYLERNIDEVGAVRLFGRGDGLAALDGDGLDAHIKALWNGSAAPAVQEGDTLELCGTLFTAGAGGSLDAASAEHLWGLMDVTAGSYAYGGALYTLAQGYEVPFQACSAPSAARGLTYNGTNQVGVAAGAGLKVKNGSGKDAGAYTAVVTPAAGYCWEDGSRGAVRIAWSIEPASLKGARVTLAHQELEETGSPLSPAVTKVTLANGYQLLEGDYELSYKHNTEPGTATVVVTGTGNAAGRVTAHFAITAAAADDGDDADDEAAASGEGDGADEDDSGEDEDAAAAAADGDDGSGGTPGEDGWTYFAPQGSAESADTSLLPSVQTPPALNIAILVVCVAAFAAAILYSTRARKETDDQQPLPQQGEARHA